MIYITYGVICMKLIRKLGTRLSKSGRLESWAIFWCDFCKQEVEKELSQGKRDKSCGCIHNKGKNNPNYKHGGKGTRLYNTWAQMKGRCLNFNIIQYKDYGGRGITVCDEWLKFNPFRDWSLSNGYADNLEIDRKENDGNYEPSNCRWVTRKENLKNKRKKYNKKGLG